MNLVDLSERFLLMQNITSEDTSIYYDKAKYVFDHIRESENTEEYYQAWKEAGKQKNENEFDTFFNDTKKNVMQKFLKDCFHADGLTTGTVVTSLYRKNDGYRIFVADAKKNFPKRERTITLAEQLLNFRSLNRGDYFLKTALFYHSNNNSYSSRNIKSCSTMMIDIDDCADMYDLPEDKWTEYVFNKYPLFYKFTPTYFLASGGKGIHAIYTFSNDIHDYSGIFQMINNLLAVIFEADMVRVGMFNSTRLPYSVNQKTGREAQLFFRGQVLDYSSFRDEILNYADEKNLIKKNADAPHKEYDKYTHGIMAQIHYTEGICKHYQTEALTEDIAEDNYGSIESLLESYLRTYGGPKEKNCKNVKDKELFKKYHALLKVQHPVGKERDQSTWSAMLHDESIPLYLRARFFDIHRTIHENAGNVIGFRNNILTIVANSVRLMGCSEKFCDIIVHHYNSFFTTPLKESEIQAILRYQYKHLVFFNNMKIADMLGLSDCTIEHSLVSYTVEQKNKRHNNYEKKRNSVKRKERGFGKKLSQKLIVFAEALDSNKSVKDAAELAGYSRSNAYRLFKEYPFLKELKEGRFTLSETKKEIHTLARAKKAGKSAFNAWKVGANFILEEDDQDEEEMAYDEYGYDLDLTKNEGLYADADEEADKKGLPSIDMQIANDQKYKNQYQIDKELGTGHGMSSLDDFIKEMANAMDKCISVTRMKMEEKEKIQKTKTEISGKKENIKGTKIIKNVKDIKNLKTEKCCLSNLRNSA